ncbi:MAG TPA: DoxX family protein [Edaphobacter sp.]
MRSLPVPQARTQRISKLETLALFYARIAVGAAFLSAVASRFGLWRGDPGMKISPDFIHRTAELNFFMPASTIPLLAWSATILEITLGLALLVTGVLGLTSTHHSRWIRWTAFGSATLLAIFGILMTLTAGIKSPLDYSVFSGSACALLLAIYPERNPSNLQP